jgi:crotonobetainyl-CoA:carnitine CoA-transferase CaiB-like acyl-CoA transferase
MKVHDASNDQASSKGPLTGIRVIDASTLFAGPVAATFLADLGADVIKVEHPSGDGQRRMGWQVDGTSLLWTVYNRNKRCVTIDLHDPDGQSMFRRLVDTADVLIENFRPGSLEKWNCGYDALSANNPGLVLLRVTAFGQTGPWANRPGFGTIAEAMSGFAYINGHADGPPTLPPFALGDSITGLFGAASILAALSGRGASEDHRGQVIDLSIVEPIFWILGPQITLFDQLGIVQGRSGNRAPFTSPRNLYKSKDDKWIAISASAQSIAERLMRMIGHAEYIEKPWFVDHVGRLEHEDELDELIGPWVNDRTAEEVMALADKWEVAACPVYSIEDIAKDPQFAARNSITHVQEEDGRSVAIQNVMPFFSETPGEHRWLGRTLGHDNDEIFLDELGVDPKELAALRDRGVVVR